MTSLDLIAASSSREDLHPTEGPSHSLATHRGGGRVGRHANRTFRNLADVACGPCLASAAVVAQAGVLHPPARIRRLASPLGRLARRPLELRGRPSVHAADVAVGRRHRGAVAVVAQGAVLQGVSGVVA